MNLADWAVGVVPDVATKLVAERTMGAARSVSVPLRDGPDQARGYREVDVLYTCIPDPVYPWDPQVLRAIWEFAPDTVPLWVQWVFLRPNSREKVVFGRHALGRAIRRPGYDLSMFRCAMPSMPCLGVTFPRPNKIWFIHEGERNPDYLDIPGAYLPFDAGIQHKARESVANCETLSDREFKEMLMEMMLHRPVRERERRRLQRADEEAQRSKDFHSYADKQFERISDVERDEYLRSVGERGRTKKVYV